MATAQEVADFRLANQSLVGLARADLSQFLGSLNLAGSPAAVRDALLEFFPELVAVYGDMAALLGADFYDALRNVPPSAASFRAVLAEPVGAAQASGTVRWAVGPLFEGAPELMAANLSGALQRLVLQPGRDSFAAAAAKDPVRTGWARVPSGAETCRWCVMLASRGAVYASQRAAAGEMRRFHDDCDCVPVAIRSPGDWPEGHSVARFEQLYADHSGVGRDLPDE